MKVNQKQAVEMADIFREHEETFCSHYTLCREQRKVYTAITQCRTAELGGHHYQCNTCGHTSQAYNSCRNRHCPKCQFIKKCQWVDCLAANLPPTKHFHIVFTIPPCLHAIFYSNQKQTYPLLFKAAGESLRRCAANTQFLGARYGAVAVLHTWGQTLVYHPHIHMIVPAGGLSEDAREWIPANPRFFLPVKILSKVFRYILCQYILDAIQAQHINLPDDMGPDVLRQQCYRKNWVVYCEKPFKSPKSIIAYLGNYTHRVAISNHRIVSHENNMVTFRYKDYKQGGATKTLTLHAHEFIRRFLQHVLPARLSKIRYYGFLALRHLKENLDQCCELLFKAVCMPRLAGLNGAEVLFAITGKNPFQCPVCEHGQMVKLLISHSESG